jgi:small multidrug resistance family-3 protein
VNDAVSVLRSLVLFAVAGVCEIGGGWLVWKSLRDGKPAWWSLAGAVILILYGIIPTLQASHFGRIYAVYGGFFIALSLLWGWGFDGNMPDPPDVIGGVIALVGVCVMMYWPRPAEAENPPELASKTELVASFDVVGKTLPAPGRAGTIQAVPDHPVKEVLVALGDHVKVGQPILRLGTEDAELHAKKTALAELQSEWARRQAHPPEQEQSIARTALEEAGTATGEARKTLEGLESLWKKGEVSEPRYRKARSVLALCEAEEKVAAARMERLLKQPVDLEIAELQARINAAKTAVSAAERESENRTVTAPISGTVTRLDVIPGAVAKAGAPAWGEVLDLSELDVRCELTAQQAQPVAVGSGVEVKQLGSPAAVWKGRIVFVGVAADRQTGLVPVLVRLKNSGDDRLRCYVEVNVRFGVEAIPQATRQSPNGTGTKTSGAGSREAVAP